MSNAKNWITKLEQVNRDMIDIKANVITVPLLGEYGEIAIVSTKSPEMEHFYL